METVVIEDRVGLVVTDGADGPEGERGGRVERTNRESREGGGKWETAPPSSPLPSPHPGRSSFFLTSSILSCFCLSGVVGELETVVVF